VTQPPPPPAGAPSAPWQSPPPGWSPPGTGYPGAVPIVSTSGLAVAALVTGLFFWCFVIPGVVAVILGNLALEQIADSNGAKRGRGMAIAGIVLGWVGIGIVGLVLVAWVISLLAI
jgi:Domain of unknown function (DUF4190)